MNCSTASCKAGLSVGGKRLSIKIPSLQGGHCLSTETPDWETAQTSGGVNGVHTFEVYAEVHPQPKGIDHSGLNGLPHYAELFQGHPFRTDYIVSLNQFFE